MSTQNFRRNYIIIFIHLIAINFAIAQNTSLEFWPETDIWYRISPSWRFSSFIPITKYNESKNRDLNIYLQTDYAWGHSKNPFSNRLMDENRAIKIKPLMARAGFMEGLSLYDLAESYTEEMVYTEIHFHIPLKGNILISHRLRDDLRWIGQTADFSYRLRYRIMIEKEFKVKKSSIVPYINFEPYWDSRYNLVNRVRVITGSTVSWGKIIGFEGNFTYQYDSKSSITNVFATNIILHLYFETARTKTIN